MLRIYLGKDSYSKEQRLREVAAAGGFELRRITVEDPIPRKEQLNDAPLFGPRQLFVFDNSITKTSFVDDLGALATIANEVVVLEHDTPRRGSAWAAAVKDAGTNKDIEVVQFDLMDTVSAAQWLAKEAVAQNTVITKDGITALLTALVAEPATSWEKPVVDLHGLKNELLKLITYADGEPITSETVKDLVATNASAEVWAVMNAIADKNSSKAYGALETFMSDIDGGDEKSKLILLNALLADQFRNILMIHDYQDRRVPDGQIMKDTGWKSGRVYQLKKMAARFSKIQVRQMLQRLENLDIELKSSSTPARPIMDLILAQVF